MVTSSVSQGAESEEQRAPCVFISYSWDSDEHKVWVRELATKLRVNRVDVILDYWHLRLGMDAAKFMTESVSKSDFVLVICTPEYVERSYRPKGGVRFESVIIVDEFMDNMDTQKFIPVLRQGEWNATSVPRWIKRRQGANLTGTPYDEVEFMTLVATLHGEHPAPPLLGTKPDFAKIDLKPSLQPPVSTPPRRMRIGTGLRLKEYLGPKEQELLWYAARDSGQIAHIKAISRDCLQANGRMFPETRDPRSHSEWFDALGALVQRGLIQGIGHDPDFYRLTSEGWSLDEQLGPFKRWRVKEITIERNYVGRLKGDTVALSCTSIVRLAEEYSEDRSTLYEPHSLFVEGVDRKQLEGLNFQPTDAHFVDEATGIKLEFRIKSEAKKESSTVRMPIAEMPGTRYED